MTTLEIWFTALALAMDSFTIAIASGLILKRITLRHFLTIAFCFGLFQAIMPLIGWAGSVYFYRFIEQFDHWIAFGLLFFLGVKMVKESFDKDEEHHHFNPTRLPVILTLAVATSIDALAVGISLAMAQGVNIWLAIGLIGAITFLMCCIGVKIGSIFGGKFEKKAQIAGGVILILLGLKILLEHLGILA